MSTYEESRSQLIPEALRRLVKETGEGTFGGNVKVCHVARFMIIMDTLAKERWLLNRKETFNDLTKNVVTIIQLFFFPFQTSMPSF